MCVCVMPCYLAHRSTEALQFMILSRNMRFYFMCKKPNPVLFLILINDFPDNIRSSVRLCADDCVLYRNIKSLTDCQILQDDLNSLAQWETDWQMKFNGAKCHSMRVARDLPSNQIHQLLFTSTNSGTGSIHQIPWISNLKGH